jgi:serine/threonine-protein kinase HipA
MAASLFVFLHGRRIGTLQRKVANGVEFRYDHDVPLNVSLSLSMPSAPRKRYSADKASPFFNGLLPDGPDARLRMARSFGSLDTSTYALLDKGGLDCAGAVQVYREDTLPKSPGNLVPVSDAHIGARLRSMLGDESGPVEPLEYEEHWSVSGAQHKMALRWESGAWNAATGTEPHTHIIKPGIGAFTGVSAGDQALVEHVTMSAARALGVEAAPTSYHEFDGIPAIIVERFDRYRDKAGILRRIHQEDMCQALGVDSTAKYETDGGPGLTAVADVIWSAVTVPADAEADVARFAIMVAFNYLSESSDAHAKNYSLMYDERAEVYLAPMYDAASGAIASRPDGSRRFPRAAMALGTQREFARATGSDWMAAARGAGFYLDSIVGEVMSDLVANMPDAFVDAIRHSGAPSTAQQRLLGSSMIERIAESCDAARSALAEARLAGGKSSGPGVGHEVRCGAWMPDMQRRCTLPRGHDGWPLAGHGSSTSS